MELLVLVYVMASSPLNQFNWDLFAIASLLAQWQMLFSAWLVCRCRGWLGRLSLPMATLASLALVTLATALSGGFVQVYLADLLGIAGGPRWVLRNILIANVLAATLLRYFYLQQQIRLREQWALQARLDSLQARIRPHFLFNTLNSIASLIASRPAAAEQAVEDLAELFRASLKEADGQTSVEDEVRLTRLYLDIESLRLGDRLEVDWDIDDDVMDAPMPSLIIQPLAENAVYHGISRLPTGGRIQIHIYRDAGKLVARLTNPLPAGEPEAGGNQMALANVEQRLQAIYGAEATVSTSREARRFRVELSYPLVEIVN
jgi:two-component system sensor histidine kinase AlgZ